jgi:hypothetical protein
LKDRFDCSYASLASESIPVSSITSQDSQSLQLAAQGQLPSSHSTKLTPICIAPNTALFDNDLEYQYFLVYLKRTAARLGGYYDRDLLLVEVPQMCHHEAFVRCATVAIAANHLGLYALTNPEYDFGEDTRQLEARRHHSFGLKQYGKALSLMRRLPANIQEEYQLRNALLSCYLTMTMEFYQEGLVSAARQAGFAIELLYEFCHHRYGVRPQSVHDVPNMPLISSNLLNTFVQFQGLLDHFTAQSASQATTLASKANTSVESISTIPSEFVNLDEAQSCWGLLHVPALHWRKPLVVVNTSSRFDHKLILNIDFPPVINEVNEEIRQASVGQLDKIQKWWAAFEPLFLACQLGRSSPNGDRKATIMKLNYLSTKMLLSTTALDEDVSVEAFEIIKLSREILKFGYLASSADLSWDSEQLWSDILSGLFLVATRCRISDLRTQATGFLREKLQHGTMVAAVVDALMVREEKLGCKDERLPIAKLMLEYLYQLPGRNVAVCASKLLKRGGKKVPSPMYAVNW